MGRHPRILHKLAHLEAPAGRTFEALIRDLMERQGKSAHLTPKGPDGGRDVIAEGPPPFKERYVLQAKHTTQDTNISNDTIQKYGRHALHPDNNVAAVITNAGFTGPAYEDAEEDGLRLINGEELSDLIVRSNAHDLLNRYYDRPTITDADEMLSLIDTLGRMERYTNNDGQRDIRAIVTQGKMDTNSDSPRVNVYCDAIRGLFEFGFLDLDDLPLPTGPRARHRLLVNTEPVHSNGTPMKEDERTDLTDSPRLTAPEPIYLNHHDTYDDKEKRLRFLAEYCAEKMQDAAATSRATAD